MSSDFFRELSRQAYDPATHALAVLLREPSDAELLNVMCIVRTALDDDVVWTDANALRRRIPRVRDAFLLRHPEWPRRKILAGFETLSSQFTRLSLPVTERVGEADPDYAAFWLIERLRQCQFAEEMEALCTAARRGDIKWPALIEQGADILREMREASADEDVFTTTEDTRRAL